MSDSSYDYEPGVGKYTTPDVPEPPGIVIEPPEAPVIPEIEDPGNPEIEPVVTPPPVEEVAAELTPSEQMEAFLADFNAPDITIDTDLNSPTYLQAWDYTDPENPVMIADYSNLGPQLEELQNMSAPDLSTWLAENGIEMGSIDELQTLMDEQIADIKVIDDQERADALAYAAETFGYDSEEHQSLLAELTDELADPESVQGFSDEQTAALERANAREIANQDELANKLVNNIMAATGSATIALAAADNYTNNINDYAIQSRTQLIEDDFAARQANIQSKQAFLNSMVTSGQMAKDQYIAQMIQSEATALSGYATQMQAVLDENSQYLSMYKADLDSINLSMEITYNGIMAELGVDEALASAAQTAIENYYSAFEIEADALIGQLTLAETEINNAATLTNDTINTVLSAITIVAGVAIVLFSGGTAAVALGGIGLATAGVASL